MLSADNQSTAHYYPHSDNNINNHHPGYPSSSSTSFRNTNTNNSKNNNNNNNSNSRTDNSPHSYSDDLRNSSSSSGVGLDTVHTPFVFCSDNSDYDKNTCSNSFIPSSLKNFTRIFNKVNVKHVRVTPQLHAYAIPVIIVVQFVFLVLSCLLVNTDNNYSFFGLFAPILENPSIGGDASSLSMLFISNPSLIIYKHQYHRIFLSTLLPPGLTTWLTTSVIALTQCRTSEKRWGTPAVVAIIIIGTSAASLITTSLDKNHVSANGCGFVLCLLAAMIVEKMFLAYRETVIHGRTYGSNAKYQVYGKNITCIFFIYSISYVPFVSLVYPLAAVFTGGVLGCFYHSYLVKATLVHDGVPTFYSRYLHVFIKILSVSVISASIVVSLIYMGWYEKPSESMMDPKLTGCRFMYRFIDGDSFNEYVDDGSSSGDSGSGSGSDSGTSSVSTYTASQMCSNACMPSCAVLYAQLFFGMKLGKCGTHGYGSYVSVTDVEVDGYVLEIMLYAASQ